jgi:hypothetical protein
MKINHNSNRSKLKWLIIPIILLILAGGTFVTYKWLNKNESDQNSETRPVNTVDYGPPTKAEQQQVADAKKPNSAPDNQNTSVSILISRASQSTPTSPIAVRTIISGATTGNCEMIFTKGGTTFTKTFEIKSDATTYTCNGDIEASNFNEAGDWTLTVAVGSTSTQYEDVIHVQK